MEIDWASIQKKWTTRWNENHLFDTNPDASKPKFYITVAYPYPNSPQHIGHGRTYTLADVHARYKRMQGYNVLLPMAFHYTGTPILAISKRIVEQDSNIIDTFIEIYKVSPEKLKEFSNPLAIAQYFHNEIKSGMIDIGYSIDWRREFTTIDPKYSSFIQWQFRKLKELKYITRGSHPVGWCPKDGNPVGQHDTIGDIEPEIGEYVLIKFRFNSSIIPTATLRPETVFGVTNLWINPNETYVSAKIDKESWIVSENTVEKLRFQGRSVNIQKVFLGKELIGKFAENVATKSKIPILPASFVDSNNGTGVVMSVPAHAPYDYQGLEDLKKSDSLGEYDSLRETVLSINPISLIQSADYGDIPAIDIIKKLNITDQSDPNLEEATSTLYSHEFHAGLMKENTNSYSGLSVSVARDKVKEDFLRKGQVDIIFEIFNTPVKCRCGAECVVKLFENQWFINYGDIDWKNKVRHTIENMRFYPEEMKPEFEYTVGWLREKACARKSGLGTILPWDKEWIIESLSDSVLYMAYYTISHHLNNTGSSTKLNDNFFNYIFLGSGKPTEISREVNIDVKSLKDMRQEFLYFYPLDVRHSGRDLVPNHLTFFIFNHTAIFPEEHRPRSIVVNGSVLMNGKKMSKSFGNIIPLKSAIKKYGADPLRLAIMATAELLQDADMSLSLIQTFKDRLERIYAFTEYVLTLDKSKIEHVFSIEDRWIMSRLQNIIYQTTEAMEKMRVREAIHHAIYVLDADIAKYQKMISTDRGKRLPAIAQVLREIVETRIKLIAPFAPFISEELWEKISKSGFVFTASWPQVDKSRIDQNAEIGEELVSSLLSDTLNISKVTKINPKKIVYYIAANWKWKGYLLALKLAKEDNLSVSELIKQILEGSNKHQIKEKVDFAKKTVDNISTMPTDLLNKRLKIGIIDELSILKEFLDYCIQETQAEILVFNEDDPLKYDPQNKSNQAKPYRPSIFIEES